MGTLQFKVQIVVAHRLHNVGRKLVGMPGFEPGTSCTPSRRASQAALHPDRAIDGVQSTVKSLVYSLQSKVGVYFLDLALATVFFFDADGATRRSSAEPSTSFESIS